MSAWPQRRQLMRLMRPGKRSSVSCCKAFSAGWNQTVLSPSVMTRTPSAAPKPSLSTVPWKLKPGVTTMGFASGARRSKS